MVLILDGNTEHVAYTWKKAGLFGKKTKLTYDCSRSNQMAWTDQIT